MKGTPMWLRTTWANWSIVWILDVAAVEPYTSLFGLSNPDSILSHKEC